MLKTETKRKLGYRINIDRRRCKGCGICVFFCPKKCLELDELEGKACVVDEESCVGCLICELRCPDFAIDITKENEETSHRK